MARLCPDDSTEMRVQPFEGVQLDVCPRCEGMWFDAEELRTLLAQDPMALSDLEDRTVAHVEQKRVGPSPRRCPVDQTPLEQYHYLYTSPIVLDACPQCGGFFVEDGELGKMQEWLDKIRRPMTSEEKDRLILAQAQIAHGDEMQRQQNRLHFFNTLRRFQPGWIGLIP